MMITKKISIIIIASFFIFLKTFAQDSILVENIIRGDIQFKNKNFVEAEKLYSAAIKIKNNDSEIYIKRGQTLFELKNYDAAINDYQIAKDLKNDLALYKIAESYAELNNSKKSCYFLNLYLKTNSKIYESEIKQNKAFEKITDSQEWINLWKNDYYNSQEKLLAEANYQMQRNNDNEAFLISENILAKNKKKHEAHYLRGELFLKTKEYKNAAKSFEEAHKIKQKNFDYLQKAGDAYFLAKKYKNALEAYEKCSQQNAADIELIQKKAECLFILKKYDEANTQIDKYLYYNNLDFKALFLSAKIKLAQNELFKALEQINICIINNINTAEYYTLRADIYAQTESYTNASNDYSMALDLQPDQAEVYYKLGNIKFKLNETQSACSNWNTALRKGYYKAADKINIYCK